MALIADLTINLSANVSKLGAGLQAAGKKVSDFKTTVMSGASKAGSALSGAITTAATACVTALAAVAAAAVAAGAALGALTLAQFEGIDAMAKQADKLGMSTEALAGLRHMAEASGTDLGQLDSALSKLNVTVSQAANGNKAAAKAFAALGLDAKKLNDLPAEQRIKVLADQLAKIPNVTDRARIGTQIFGKSFQNLWLTLREGSEGMAKFEAEAERLGLTFSREAAGAVEAANDAWDRTKKSVQGIGIQLAPLLAPFVENIADILTEVIVRVRQFVMEWQPHMVQLFNVWKGIWTACMGIFQAIWQQIVAIMSPIVGWIAEQLGMAGMTLDDFKTTGLQALIAIEFYLTNWERVWNLTVTNLAYMLVKFANDVVNLFTNVIPQVFISFGQFTMTFFANLGKNIVNGVKAIWKAIKGGGWEFVWQPLTEGFNQAMSEIGDSFNREESPLEKALREDVEAQQQSLTDDLSAFMDQRMQELQGTGEATKEAVSEAMPDLEDLGLDEEEVEVKVKHEKAQAPGIAEKGSAAAFGIIAESMKRAEDKLLLKQQVGEAKKQNDNLEKILEAIEENGLEVANL